MRGLFIILCAGLLLDVCPVSAQATADTTYHVTTAQIQAAVTAADGSALPRTLGRLLGDRGDYTLIVLRRTQTSEVEAHDEWDDVMIIQEGSANVVSGGSVRGSRITAPGEHRGGEIEGGRLQPVTAGELLVLPAGLPHQVRLEPGQEVTYLLIKIRRAGAKPPASSPVP